MGAAGLKLYFDGGCRPNPGPIETAVVARGVLFLERGLPPGDSCRAEWLALLHALRVARQLGADDIVLLGDSALVVHQARGDWKCRSAELAELRQAFDKLGQCFARTRIRHVKRSHNLAGIALERIRSGI
ncbi:MAG: reverse transcriptase-like protein [Pseudomonadota bacterium]